MSRGGVVVVLCLLSTPRAEAGCWGGAIGSGCYGYPTPTSCTTATAGSPGCCCWTTVGGQECTDPSNDPGTNCPDQATSSRYCGANHISCTAGQYCSAG